MNDIRLGIIGFGWMAFFHHQNIIPKDSGIKVAAVYDKDPARLEFAESLGIRAYDKLDGFFASDINAVLVATPNDSHKEYCIAALNSGRHVICEKPATMNAPELEEIIKTAESVNRLFTVHHNRRWDRDFRVVQKTLQEGLLGSAFFIESRVQGANGIPGDWRREKKSGGGMLLDWGVHLIDQLMYMEKSPVTSVMADLKQIKYEVDDNIRIVMRFGSGLSALIEVCTACFIPLPRWHVHGSKGTLDIADFSCEGKVIRGTTTEIDWSLDALKHAAGATRTMRPRPHDTIETLPLCDVPDNTNCFYINFREAVLGRQELFIKPADVERVMKVLDICRESAANGVSIACEI